MFNIQREFLNVHMWYNVVSRGGVRHMNKKTLYHLHFDHGFSTFAQNYVIGSCGTIRPKVLSQGSSHLANKNANLAVPHM